jgi:putative glutamine amidotransferase
MLTKTRFILFAPRFVNKDIFSSLAIGTDLVNYISQKGFVPIIIPYTSGVSMKQLKLKINDYLVICDGLILLGGQDICIKKSYIRDKFEFELVKQAMKQKKAIFGICRGMQMINLVLGGTIFEDLGGKNIKHVATKSELVDLKKIESEHACDRTMHKIIFEKESKILMSGFKKTHKVNSIHHQAIDKLGKNLKVEAWSDDGIIEIISDYRARIVAVQFHPELDIKNTFYRNIIDLWLNFI